MKIKRLFLYLLLIVNVYDGIKSGIQCSNGKNRNQYSLVTENKSERIEIFNLQNKHIKNNSDFHKIIDIKHVSEIISSVYTAVKYGLCDKTFLITIVLFTNYKFNIVFVSSFLSISIIEYSAIYLNFVDNLYTLQEWIDIFAVLYFNIFGVMKIVEGLKQSQYDNQSKMLEIQKEINKSLTLEESMNDGGNHLNISVGKEMELSNTWDIIKITVICYVSIFFSEAGDKTQFSTIYVTQNSIKILIFSSLILAHFILIFLSAGIALGINKIASKKAVSILSGAIFIYLAIICAHLIYINNYLIMKGNKLYNNNIKLIRKI